MNLPHKPPKQPGKNWTEDVRTLPMMIGVAFGVCIAIALSFF